MHPSLKSLSLEETLLIESIKFYQSSSDIDLIRNILSSRLDWDSLISISERHAVTAILFDTLNSESVSEFVPQDVLEGLEKFYRVNSMWNNLLFSRLASVINFFEEHQISALSIKGPVLAIDLYGDVGLRQFADLDLLINRKDVQQTKELLISKGYKLDVVLPKGYETHFESNNYYYNFLNQKDEMSLDLHWSLITSSYSFSIQIEEILESSKELILDNNKFKVMNNELLIIYLSLHGAKHGWCQLNWVLDLAQLILKSDINWDFVIKRTKKLQVEKMVYLGIMLAAEIFNIDLASNIKNELNSASHLVINFRIALSILFPPTNKKYPNTLKIKLFYMSLMPSIKDKLVFFYESVLKPTSHEWAVVRLPKDLYFLYYLVRPLRLTGKYVKKYLG